MTRRHKPTMISVDHTGTYLADLNRERAKPVPTPVERAPEPTPAPAAQPKPGRGKAIKVVQTPIPAGTVVMHPDEAKALRNMFALARETTTDKATKARLARAEDQVVKATRGPKL